MKRLLLLFFGVLLYALLLQPDTAWATTGSSPPHFNMPHIYLTLGILLIAAVLFFTELIPLAVTSILVPCALSTLGIITVKEAWVSFGDTSILTIVGLFMLGEATFATGFAQRTASWVISRAGTGEARLIVVAIAMIGVMSAFLNNAGVTAITLPMIISVARKAHLSPSRILLPTAYAASVGGMISLVGQAPNMVMQSIMTKMAPDITPFGFFEFAWFGIPLLAATVVLYSMFGRWLMPQAREDMTRGMVVEDVPFTPKMYVAGGIFLLVIFCMATGIVPLTSGAMLGAMLCIITRCMSVEQAFKAVDWTTVYLFAGMLSMSYAMEKTGAAKLLADNIMYYISDPMAILAITCLVTSIVTNIMSNTATTAIMVPLVIPLALDLGYSPLPFAMGVAASACACFMTPIATPSNTLVLRPGNYTFFDYIRYGWPMQILSFIMCMVIIPRVWPFIPK